MKELDNKTQILKILDYGTASIGTLKQQCGQGNKITNLRKAFHRLLTEGLIEIKGYNKECKSFKLDCFMFRKTDGKYKNPIYVRRLLENPFEGNNFLKIRDIFRNRIVEINQIFLSETELLAECIEQMPLRVAIDADYIGIEEDYGKEDVKFSDILVEHPEAKIWYFKKPFKSKLAPLKTDFNGDPPYFIWGKKLDLDANCKKMFIKKNYVDHFNFLPVSEEKEHFLFRNIVIEALKEEVDKKDERLWLLASKLTEDGPGLIQFVKKLFQIDKLFEKFYCDDDSISL